MVKKGLVWFIMFHLLFTLMPVSGLASGNEAGGKEPIPLHTVPPLGTVPLGGGSEIVAVQADLVRYEKNWLFVSIEFRNLSAWEADLKDYWLFIRDSEGRDYPAKLVEDPGKTRIPPRTAGAFTFYAEVGEQADIGDFSIRIIRWNFDLPDLEEELAVFNIPNSYSSAVPEGKGSMITLDGTDLVVRIEKVVANSNDEELPVAVYLQLENLGTGEFTLSDQAEFGIQTADGNMYVIKTDPGQKEKTIAPKSRKSIRLSGKVVRRPDLVGAKFVVLESSKDSGQVSKPRNPLAGFMLPVPSGDEVAGGEQFEFSTEDGLYIAQLKVIKRVPWENEDLLQASFVLRATGSELLPVPKLSGYFLIDDNVQVAAEFVRPDEQVGVSDQVPIKLIASGGIPYLSDPQKVSFVLQEVRKEGKDEVARFGSHAVQKDLPIIRVEQTHRTDYAGRSAGYAVKRVRTYSNGVTQLFSAQLEVANMEKRLAVPDEVTGYLQMEDGLLHPIQISAPSGKLAAGGKELIHVWSMFPQEMKLKNPRLILGPKWKGNDGETKLGDVYVEPVAYELPDETEGIKSFRGMKFEPYELTMNRFETKYDFFYGEWSFGFDYELNKDAWVQANTDDYNIVIEIEDFMGRLVHEEWLKLDKGSSSEPALRLGKHLYQFKRFDRETLTEMKSVSEHKLKVSVVFQGHKRLLAEKKVTSFTQNIDLLY